MQTMIKLHCKLSDLDLHCLPGPVDQKMVITENLMVFFFFKLHEHLKLNVHFRNKLTYCLLTAHFGNEKYYGSE